MRHKHPRFHGTAFAATLVCCMLQFAPGRLYAQETVDTDDPLLLSTTIDVSYEYRYRSANHLVETSTYKNGIDLYRNIIDVPPMLLVDWEYGRTQGLAFGVAAEIRKQFIPGDNGAFFPADNFPVLGLSGNSFATENGLLTKGAIYWRSDSLDIGFGRDKVDFGEGLRGSLYPSARLPYLDAFQAKGRLGPLKMDWMIASIRDEESWDGIDVKPNDGLDESHDDVTDYYPYGFRDDLNPTAIIAAVHRFTWDFGAFQLGVAGHVMYARRNNRFLITDFLPVISWHQADIVSNNLTVYIDASWEPFEGLRVMGMAGVDEVDARDVGVNDSGSPTVPGWVLGAEYAGRHGPGRLELYLEAGYTHFLWGNFDGSNYESEDVNPLERAIYRLQMDAGAGLLPLTSPYGPGATWGLLSGRYEFSGLGLSVGLDILALSKMIDANLIDTPVFTDDPAALTADSPRFFFLDLAVPVSLKLSSFELSVEPAVCVRDGTWWFEATLGIAYNFNSAIKIGAR